MHISEPVLKQAFTTRASCRYTQGWFTALVLRTELHQEVDAKEDLFRGDKRLRITSFAGSEHDISLAPRD
jgi:hypothetical protein